MSRCWISVTGIFCHILQHQLLPLLNLGDKACLGLDHCVMLTIDMQTQSVKDAFITPAQDSCLRPRIRLLHVTEDDRESMQSRMSSEKHHTRPEFASVDNNEWIVSAWHAWVFNSGLIFHCTWIILCLAVIHFRAGWLGPYWIHPLNLQDVHFPVIWQPLFVHAFHFFQFVIPILEKNRRIAGRNISALKPMSNKTSDFKYMRHVKLSHSRYFVHLTFSLGASNILGSSWSSGRPCCYECLGDHHKVYGTCAFYRGRNIRRDIVPTNVCCKHS